MKIQTVTVECHEKRAHPSEMGHYDSSVSYTAEVDEGEIPEKVVERIQFVARQQVANELDRWIAEIKTRQAQESARNNVQWIIERADHSNVERSGELAKFEKDLAILPANEHAEWIARLDAARAEFRAGVEKVLGELIGKASKRELKHHERGNFDGLLGDVPEEDRQDYMDKMSDAIAACELNQAFGGIVTKPEETATQVESRSDSDKEEVPF